MANSKGIESIKVELGERGYEIIVSESLLPVAGKNIKPLLKTPRVFVITDEIVAKLHLKTLETSLAEEGIRFDSIILPAGEETKSFANLEKLLDKILCLQPERNVTLIALGGGVIGDITGFAASILLRGVDFVQIPTTLLAMVDSSVGGKTGINTKQGKNLVGSFYQPRLVLADLSLLRTLPEREFLAGYAEIVKYALICDAKMFDDLQTNIIAHDDFENLQKLVIKSCSIKAEIVSADEKESGKRALLNLGHTFAHAMEAEMGYDGRLLHGEAVAVGLVMALRFSAKLGLCSGKDADRVEEHLFSVGLPTSPLKISRNFRAVKLLEHMYQDKKVKDGKLVFVLARGIGDAFIKKDVDEKLVLGFLEEVLAA